MKKKKKERKKEKKSFEDQATQSLIACEPFFALLQKLFVCTVPSLFLDFKKFESGIRYYASFGLTISEVIVAPQVAQW